LVTSIASPFIGFYWLQGELRVRALKAEHFVVKTIINIECDNPSSLHVIYGLQLINSGIFPIEKVKVVMTENFYIMLLPESDERATLLKEDGALNQSAVKLTPPIEFSSEKHGDFVTVNIKDPLPPHSKFFLELATYSHLYWGDHVELLGPYLWVYSDVAPPPKMAAPGVPLPDEYGSTVGGTRIILIQLVIVHKGRVRRRQRLTQPPHSLISSGLTQTQDSILAQGV
jgi:hypothetical protein